MPKKALVKLGEDNLTDNVLDILDDGWDFYGEGVLFVRDRSILILQTRGYEDQELPILLTTVTLNAPSEEILQ